MAANSVWVTWPALTKLGSLGILAGLLTLAAERDHLFEHNLIAVEDLTQANGTITCDERSHTARTEDGTCNILDNPAEGSVYRRFGRNVALSSVHGETINDTLLSPNPREVSNSLMARTQFKPATTLNFIAGAWIQFMVHDWVSHGENVDENPILVPLPAGDSMGSGYLEVKHTAPDLQRTAEEDATLPVTYRNVNTHWWDGSQIYGSSKTVNDTLRSFIDGKLRINEDGTLPTDFVSGIPVQGVTDNWWVGLSMMHQLFVKEHNAIADMLKANHPDASDQWLYDKARLINAALMAKIHTVEWTPAIIANPVTIRAMYANWWGLLGTREKRDDYHDEIQQLVENLQNADALIKLVKGVDSNLAGSLKVNGATSLDHAIAGIVGSAAPNNHGTDYTLTEEFVSVYRMHPLMRSNIEVYDIGTNVPSNVIPTEDTRNGAAEDILESEGADRLWYSFGITNPGSLTLKNYPNFLRNLSVPFGPNIDLAATDIIRDRERGVPRYNEFRRQIHLTPITKFEDLTTDPALLGELKRLYSNDIEKIDTMVGMMAETVRPEGFGFGETAFQVFIMNASRRLMTDRFFTQDYTAEVYTAEGLDWVENNTMVDVLKRHFPSLAPSLAGVDNAFKPWGLNLPDNYQQLAACDKQSLLWENGVLRTDYRDSVLPPLAPIDIFGLLGDILWQKVKDDKDITPPGYKKPIHPYGAMAKVAFVPAATSPYTGLFKGNDCGFMRLSLTGDPSIRGFAPGLAWKVFVDGKPSENVSALYTLSGQGTNYNFFANELSQYVSVETNETLATALIFKAVTAKPTQLLVDDMAKINDDGSAAVTPKAPTQIYFVPTAQVKSQFATSAHDFRKDLRTLSQGTTVYELWGTSDPIQSSIVPATNVQLAAARRASAVKMGEIVLTSPFIVSQFGDSGLFFKHQRVEDK